MPKTVNFNVRMDEELKKQFENFCSDMGLSMTTAITIFAKKVVRDYRIPFEIGAETPNKETIEAIKEVEEMKKNPSAYKQYNSFDEILEELNNAEL